uniref:Uncharacterized protein n=1 Tax=Anguilla anguilla TaxID=7936 RepID=A0A0E9XNY5_ANGAN
MVDWLLFGPAVFIFCTSLLVKCSC